MPVLSIGSKWVAIAEISPKPDVREWPSLASGHGRPDKPRCAKRTRFSAELRAQEQESSVAKRSPIGSGWSKNGSQRGHFVDAQERGSVVQNEPNSLKPGKTGPGTFSRSRRPGKRGWPEGPTGLGSRGQWKNEPNDRARRGQCRARAVPDEALGGGSDLGCEWSGGIRVMGLSAEWPRLRRKGPRSIGSLFRASANTVSPESVGMRGQGRIRPASPIRPTIARELEPGEGSPSVPS